MRVAATQPHVEPENLTGFLGELQYDDYRSINFRTDRSRWADTDSMFRIQAFHLGWLFGAPVRLYDVTDGYVHEVRFSTDDFEYRNELSTRVAAHVDLPGVAGFRLNFPLNRPDVFDELVAFLGASYFRALGRGNGYGISARGLAVNTATSAPEEFPRFSRFYLERPHGGGLSAVLYAAMESPSVTGAYRFVITPGIETMIEVTARLFFRSAVTQLGVAPLTSMFLFSEKNRATYDDFRPNVHDSDGLAVRRRDGDILWRPLNNPPRLASSYFGEGEPAGLRPASAQAVLRRLSGRRSPLRAAALGRCRAHRRLGQGDGAARRDPDPLRDERQHRGLLGAGRADLRRRCARIRLPPSVGGSAHRRAVRHRPHLGDAGRSRRRFGGGEYGRDPQVRH